MICDGRTSSYKAPKLVVINSGKKIPRGLRAARGKKRGTAGCVAAKSSWRAPQMLSCERRVAAGEERER